MASISTRRNLQFSPYFVLSLRKGLAADVKAPAFAAVVEAFPRTSAPPDRRLKMIIGEEG
jgi:hypothetical protein